MNAGGAGTTPPVTVVVPVYGDLSTLVPCVESLIENVNQSVHRILLVNDCGPQVDEIERTLLDLIDGEPSFAYARNEKNLGFVGTCNRAAFELDDTDNDILLLNSDTITTPGFVEELSAVLHLSPQHGAVCPRSNNATIASLPFKLRDPSTGRTMERAAAVHAALKEQLPRFSVAPVAMGFCLLIRRELIRQFGLFDEAFAPGYGEENDFCLRIGQHGFLSLIAHRALVFHVGGRSFVGGRREALRSAHEKLLVTRYPFYTKALQSYIHVERDPVDVFADVLVPGDEVIRVLIDIDRKPTSWDIELLSHAAKTPHPGVSIAVAIRDRAAAGLSIRFPSLTVIRHSRLDGLWDVALSCTDRPSDKQHARLNRTAARWVIASSEQANSASYMTNAVLCAVDEVLQDLVEKWGRFPIDVKELRVRWDWITQGAEYLEEASKSREPGYRRLVRYAERISPSAVGRAKGIFRRVFRSL